MRCIEDGQPHPLATNADITYCLKTIQEVSDCEPNVLIHTTYIAIMIVAESEGIMSEIAIWNWQTGQQMIVLTGPVHSFFFLDDFLLCGVCRPNWTCGSNESTLPFLSLDFVDFKRDYGVPVLDMMKLGDHGKLFLPPLTMEDEDEIQANISVSGDSSSSSARRSPSPITERPFSQDASDCLLKVVIQASETDGFFAFFARASTLLGLARAVLNWEDWGIENTRVLDMPKGSFCNTHGLKLVIPARDTGELELLDFNMRGPPLPRVVYEKGITRFDDSWSLFQGGEYGPPAPLHSALPYRAQHFNIPREIARDGATMEVLLTDDGIVVVQTQEVKLLSVCTLFVD